jgi:hypothetical protein
MDCSLCVVKNGMLLGYYRNGFYPIINIFVEGRPVAKKIAQIQFFFNRAQRYFQQKILV